jgi:hypothetical protein
MNALTRLAAMFPGGRLSLLAIAAATLLAGCGGEDGTIPADSADQLTARLTEVEGAVAEGNCDGAQASANLFVTQVDQLPDDVDDEVERALVAGGQRLQQLATEQCEEPDTGATGESGFVPEEPVEEPPVEPTEEQTTGEETTDEQTQPPDEGQDGGNQGGGADDGGNQRGGTGPGTGGVGEGD